MLIDDEVEEKKIIGIFLLNMGILYLLMEDFDFSCDFINEAIETLERADEAVDYDIAVRQQAKSSDSIHIASCFDYYL